MSRIGLFADALDVPVASRRSLINRCAGRANAMASASCYAMVTANEKFDTQRDASEAVHQTRSAVLARVFSWIEAIKAST
jgi:hypothetical protein